MSEAAVITDDELDRMISDPALILTHEQALEVLETLDDEIASIQAQIDAAQIESNAKPMSPDRLRWLQRASYAAAMRRNERHRVMQRDKELRGTKNFGGHPKDPTKKEANIVKQQRLAVEVEIRRAAKQADLLKLQNESQTLAQRRREFQAQREREFERQFVSAARGYLSAEQFEEIRSMVKLPPSGASLRA